MRRGNSEFLFSSVINNAIGWHLKDVQEKQRDSHGQIERVLDPHCLDTYVVFPIYYI